MGHQVARVTWEHVYDWLRVSIPKTAKVWGIPRGGAIIAGISRQAVDAPYQADIIIDDIIDSGRTIQRYQMQYPNKEFKAMFDKRQMDKKTWVIFPWEDVDETRDVEDTVVRQLEFIGENPRREGLIETPKRVIKALKELTSGYQENPAVILSKVFTEPYDEMIVLKDIEMWSLCEHHMLPFHGRAHVGYIPNGKIIGISKIARLVHCFARRLQVQERLTQEIANALMESLKPHGVGVIIQATHLCMACRGVKTPADMTTSCLLGYFRDRSRSEFLQFINGR